MEKFMFSVFLLLFHVFCSGFVYGKECASYFAELASHTLRYELSSSDNETWKAEMFSHYHVTPTDDSAWANLLPRKALLEEGKEQSWALMYGKMKHPQVHNKGQGVGNFLKELSLHDVRLAPNSRHGWAQQTNLEYLLMLDVDSLVWSFRKTAGLPTPGKPYGGWEAPDCELRGHFVGHYLSASALMWASTHNDTLHEKMSAVVSALDACQKKMGTGYLSAFPSELFDRVEAIKVVWAPYYTIHKVLAGLLDQYTFANNTQALKMVVYMVEYFYNRVQNVISKFTIERHWLSLNEEFGGMNDVLYNLYSITNDQKHLTLAHLFDKPCFLGLLAMKVDSITGFHANTHIPIVIGSQMRYETTGDPLYKEIGRYFMDIVNSSHSYASAGTSVNEHWTDAKRLADTLQTENEESCATYNMLKVSRHLFRWTKEMSYADYYERALTNGVLSIQRGREPGVMIYMLPMGRGVSKAVSIHGWGTKFDTFWCCYGTATESFSKLGDSIYFEEEGKLPGLYIIQFISSTVDWKSGHIVINQTVETVVSWDSYLRVTLTVSTKERTSQSSKLNLRVPSWTYSNGARATLNVQQPLHLPQPGNFLSVTRQWSSGDKLTLRLPLGLRIEAIQDDRPEYKSIQAILYGPYLLAGLTSGDWDIKTGAARSPSDWITAIPKAYNSQLVSLSQVVGNATLVLMNRNNAVTMDKLPEPGTSFTVYGTFRLILKDMNSSQISSPVDAIGKFVMLEPFDLPGMKVVQQGPNGNITVASASGNEGLSTFRVVPGLDGKKNSVSLESQMHQKCFVHSGLNNNVPTSAKLSCQSETANAGFRQAVSFSMNSGIAEYHPISFVAKGASRNFLLMPLLSLRDETYTVYFNITS